MDVIRGSRPDDQPPLRRRREITESGLRFGAFPILVLLQPAGWLINRKRVWWSTASKACNSNGSARSGARVDELAPSGLWGTTQHFLPRTLGGSQALSVSLRR
jgi:hypothetical protein